MEDIGLKLVATRPECYDELFVNQNLLDGPCLHVAVGNGLEYVGLFASMTVFLPQILKLLWSRKSDGISFIAVALELVAMAANFVYAYHNGTSLSEYKVAMYLVVQMAVIAFLVLILRSDVLGAVGLIASCLAALTFFTSQNAPLNLVEALKTSSVFIVLASRLLQTLVCFKNKSSGQMSTVTWLILLCLATSNLFSIVQKVPINPMLMVPSITESALNGTILSQVMFSDLFYGTSADHLKKKTKKA